MYSASTLGQHSLSMYASVLDCGAGRMNLPTQPCFFPFKKQVKVFKYHGGNSEILSTDNCRSNCTRSTIVEGSSFVGEPFRS